MTAPFPSFDRIFAAAVAADAEAARFRRLTEHLRINGKPIEVMPHARHPEAEKLRAERAKTEAK